MQQKFLRNFFFGPTLAVWAALLLTGCPAPKPSTVLVASESVRPFAGQSLKVVCPDSEISAALGPIANAWASKNGARVVFEAEGEGDIAVVRSMAFGEGCARGEFSTLGKAVRSPTHPLQIFGQLDAYYEGLAGWQGQPHGVMLAVDAAVVLYRKDRFNDPSVRAAFKTRKSRDLTPPNTWDEYTEVASFFTKLDGRPAIPAFPRDPARRLDLFHRIAATMDRPAITPSNMAGRTDKDLAADAFSFHFDFKTGRPRLTSPGFTLAADILKQQTPFRGEGDGDPIVAIQSGKAVLAIATMSDLARLSKGPDGAVPQTIAVARLPGSRRYADALTGQVESVRGSDANIVPYLSGGWIGAVRTRTTRIDAANDLLGHFGGPEGAGAIISRPAIGSGPWRADLLDANKKNLWFAYGFGPDQTQALMTALRPYIASDLRNPAVAPRGPGIEKLMGVLAERVADAAEGRLEPAVAIKQAQDAWILLEATAGSPEQVLSWRRGDMRAK